MGPEASASVKAEAAAIAPGALGKGEEEGVALRIDLDATFGCTRLADDAAV